MDQDVDRQHADDEIEPNDDYVEEQYTPEELKLKTRLQNLDLYAQNIGVDVTEMRRSMNKRTFYFSALLIGLFVYSECRNREIPRPISQDNSSFLQEERDQTGHLYKLERQILFPDNSNASDYRN